MDKSAYANKDYKLLARLARPYCPDKGPNSWEHIQLDVIWIKKRA